MKTQVVTVFDGITFSGVTRADAPYADRMRQCYAVIQGLVYSRLNYMPDVATIKRHTVRVEITKNRKTFIHK